MFIVSVKLSRKRILTSSAALVLVVGLGITGLSMVNNRNTVTSVAPTGQSTSEKKIKSKKVSAKTPEERLAYIQSFGWEATPEPAEVLEVIIPEEFDSVYQQYNSIQKKQGFDLTSFAGKRVKRYSYVVTNYPGATGEIRFNLLIQGDKVIGGDVCSLEQNGFMHGFAAADNAHG